MTAAQTVTGSREGTVCQKDFLWMRILQEEKKETYEKRW